MHSRVWKRKLHYYMITANKDNSTNSIWIWTNHLRLVNVVCTLLEHNYQYFRADCISVQWQQSCNVSSNHIKEDACTVMIMCT